MNNDLLYEDKKEVVILNETGHPPEIKKKLANQLRSTSFLLTARFILD